MSLKIIKAGILDTIQDLGRYGYQDIGINPTGAMDKYALQVTNMLVGNDPAEAGIEMHFPAAVFLFSSPALFALGGADFAASINGEPVPLNQPLLVGKNDLLQFHKPVQGARVYLSVSGGFKIEPWLGSRSTHLKAGAGGFAGRKLHKDDELQMRNPPDLSRHPVINPNDFKILHWHANPRWQEDVKEIFVLPGHEWDWLSTGGKESFEMTSFVLTQHADRMGYRMNNIPLPAIRQGELVSSAVDFGTIQLLPDGKLIILMADHQTAGGYPRIGQVITAHHSRLAQMRPADKIHFRITDQITAENLLFRQKQHLSQLQNACKFRLEEFLNAHAH
jgi:antagonist of KipI